MLVHQLRAEEDAILVGRLTDEREHPQLNVREWNGQSPMRFILSHEHPIDAILHECYERSLQSLIVEGGRQTLQSFIDIHRAALAAVDRVKVYYDCGQSPVTNLLHGTFAEALGKSVEFKQNVRPLQYRLFQIADLVCTLRLIELRLAHGMSMTQSEMRFFGGPRDFKRNVLKKIKRKEI